VAAFVALTPAAKSLVELYGGGQPVEFLVTTADERTVVMRSIEPDRWVGKPLAGTDFAQAAGKAERQRARVAASLGT